MKEKSKEKGLVHYYYGYGCGKTSIALGHVVRALGHNLKPIVIQFLKKHDPSNQKGFFYGEFVILTKKLQVPVSQFGDFNFVRTDSQIKAQKENAANGLKKIQESLNSTECDLLILDEIGSMVKLGLYNAKEIVSLLNSRLPNIEIIMTGHQEIPEFSELADYITFLKEEKHPYKRGVLARSGIDY